jgi:hypothetical protein
MPYSICIQTREDWPGHDGWQRFSRPCHQVVEELPESSDELCWCLADEAETEERAALWDRCFGAAPARAR